MSAPEISPAPSRKRWRMVGSALASVLAAAACWQLFGTRVALPAIDFAAVEPAVQQAIVAAFDDVRERPHQGDAWGRAGMTLVAHGYQKEADACLRRAEALDPHEPRWPYLLAIRLVLENPHDAVAPLERALASCPAGNKDVYVAIRARLAETLLQIGRDAEAAEHYRALQESAGDTPRIRFGLGVLGSHKGDVQGALNHLTACEEQVFARRRAASQLAAICKRLGQDADAERHALVAATAPPDLPWPDPILTAVAQLNRGSLTRMKAVDELKAQGRRGEAIRLLRAEVAESPHSQALVILGMMLAEGGEGAEAETVLRSTLETNPEKTQAMAFLSVALLSQADEAAAKGNAEAARTKFGDAESWAQRTLKIQPQNVIAWTCLGHVARRTGRFPEAVRAYREAIACRPALIEVHAEAIRTLLRMEDAEQAAAMLADATKLHPTHPALQALAAEFARRK